MYSIQTLNKISAKGLDRMDRDHYEIASEITHPDAILVRSMKLHDREFPETVKAIGRAGAGVNNIPLDKCTEQGIVVFNTPGANANSVKELVLAGLLLSSRDIIGGVNWIQGEKDKGDEVPKIVEKGKSNYAGPEIMGKTLGVIGLGAIGALVANAASSLGMKVLGYDPFISVDAAWGLSSDVSKAISLDQMLSQCDYISLHLLLNDKTRGLIGGEKFEVMKKGIRILNFARGGLVDNEQLMVELEKGTVSCYVTDFPEAEILGNPKVITVPHLGASSPEAEENCAIMAVDQIKDYLENGNIKNSVNFPACSMERTGDQRLIIANKNVPDMMHQFLGVLADAGINVDNMTNRNKGDIAYNIIDVPCCGITPEILEKIESIDGVIMTRILQ
ncbi:MAG: 3-phosphoglycerate dehydrogenase family protein [Spirochaetales bacterium]|nr:3-phosphoglycerate dehydrogenase family protein [Spirochaetales bacterium]